MPYKTIDEIPASLQGIEPPISLGQANIIAAWTDAMERAEDGPESPWGAAIAQFKRLYESDGEKWTKIETKAAVTCECLDCEYIQPLPDGEHCIDIECFECGGEMRRQKRPSSGQLQFISNKIGAKTTRKVHDDVDYLIAPTITIRAGVLNDALVPAEEISAFVGMWNDLPFVLAHPQENGEDTSAKTPDTLAKVEVGRFFNADFSDNRLRGEVWVDVEKCKRLGGDALILFERLEAGEPVEVSTAYYCDEEQSSGEFSGESYSVIQRNLRPDHLAALLHAEGACSWADGCGVPRTNTESRAVKDRPAQEVQQMEELIAQIVEDGRLDLTAEDLSALSEEALTRLVDSLAALATQTELDTELVENETESNAESDETQTANCSEEFEAMVAEFGGVEGVRGILANAQAIQDEQKVGLVTALAANSSLTAEQLDGLDVDTLTALRADLVPADYSGQNGGPQTNQEQLVPLVMPDVFARKEGN